MSTNLLRLLLVIGFTMLLLTPTPAEAQFFRRRARARAEARAQFDRENPERREGRRARKRDAAIDARIGQRQRRLRQAGPAQTQAPRQAQTKQPTLVEQSPLPTAEELAQMDLQTLVATQRHLSATLQKSLERFANPDGWQQYLRLPANAMGAPGREPPTIQLAVLEEQLDRYDRVAVDPKFVKIAEMPSFVATHAALELVVARSPKVPQAGPVLVNPSEKDWRNDPGPVAEKDDHEPLPVLTPSSESRRTTPATVKSR